MAGEYPATNDNRVSLLRKIAWNWYNYAIDFGASGLNPPSINDNSATLLKKIAYYTATSVEIHP